MKVSRLLRWIGLALCTVFLVLIAAFAWIWTRVQHSLPPLDGELPLPGLSAPAALSRDPQGIAIIEATNFLDLVRVQGFAHGQDRFFQMDLMRRRASGRLTELFGEKALPLDRAVVVHRFAALAEEVLANEPADRLALLEAYAAGVNAGLQSLEVKPWEYSILRTEPELWTPRDSVLVFCAMVLDLQDSTGSYDQTLTTLRDTLGTAAVDFFNPVIGPDDSALDGTTAALPAPPSAELVNLRDAPLPSTENEDDTARLTDLRLRTGSNAFALPGDRTATGAGLLAGDPHLGLALPNVWYRCQLNWRDADGTARTANGASLPGEPGLIIGSNGRIAWSFTNGYVDTGDLVPIDLNPVAPELLYRRGTETLDFEFREDEIPLKDGSTETVETTWTVFGPLVGKDRRGKNLAYKWTFHDPAAMNFAIIGLIDADTVDEALAVSADSGMPNQNLFVVDRTGAAAWTLTGRLPQRFGFDGRFPVDWSYGDRGWDGWLPADQRPVVRAAPGQAIWSGNQRQVGGTALEVLGDSGYDDPDRASQIERGLAALDQAAQPADFLHIQTAEQADWMLRWRDLLVRSFEAVDGPTSTDPDRATFRRLITTWDGRAAADSVAYRLLRAWRNQIDSLTLPPIFAATFKVDPQFRWWKLRYEAGLWALHRDEPLHLLSSTYADWNALRLAAVDRVISRLKDEQGNLTATTWGQANALHLNHPFGDFLPGPIADWVNLPVTAQSGDSHMPHVARPRFGASLRLAVSPGHEADGIFHMPGGQSGNPLSLYYRAGHQDWLRGEPSPLLPGEAEHTLTLTPAEPAP